MNYRRKGIGVTEEKKKNEIKMNHRRKGIGVTEEKKKMK